MNVQGVGFQNNLNSTVSMSAAKRQSSPSFGALRQDAVDVFMQKVNEYSDEKVKKTLLEQLLQIAQKAKNCLAVDVGGVVRKADQQPTKIRFFFEEKAPSKRTGDIIQHPLPYTFNDIYRLDTDGIGARIEYDDASKIPEHLKKLLKNPDDYQFTMPIEDFTKEFIATLDKTDENVVNLNKLIDSNDKLVEEINSLAIPVQKG